MSVQQLLLATGKYRANAVSFDGTNTYLTRGAGLTGAADGKMLTGSFWLKSNLDGVQYEVFCDSGAVGGSVNRFFLVKDNTNNNIVIRNTNTSGVQNFRIETSVNSHVAANGWIHTMFSIDLNNAASRHLYVNDVSDMTVVTFTNSNMELTNADYGVGGEPDGDEPVNGDMADFWLTFGTYVDLSVEANRRKFISSNGKPVNLGLTGELPTGAAPLIYLSGPTADWHTNKGTGGGFTENGALTDAASSPSD